MSKVEHYVPSSKINSAADIERAAAGVIDLDAKTTACAPILTSR